jgi:RNA polymerase sigma-70 factor, ECF subfamily
VKVSTNPSSKEVSSTMVGAVEESPFTESKLVDLCVLGERAAWRQLHKNYYPVSAAFLRKLGVAEDELEDACQDVFVRLFRYLPGFRGASELKTWLYRLCATEAGRLRRKRRIGQALGFFMRSELASNPPVTEQELSGISARRRLEGALSKLKPQERLVLVLYEFEGLSGEAIAKVAECPVATVWRRLHYARKTFQAELEAGSSTGGGS